MTLEFDPFDWVHKWDNVRHYDENFEPGSKQRKHPQLEPPQFNQSDFCSNLETSNKKIKKN